MSSRGKTAAVVKCACKAQRKLHVEVTEAWQAGPSKRNADQEVCTMQSLVYIILLDKRQTNKTLRSSAICYLQFITVKSIIEMQFN